MWNLRLILTSFKKQKNRNIFLIIELTLGFLIMFLVLGRLEYNFQYVNKSLKVVDSNVYRVFTFDKSILFDDSEITKNSFSPATVKPLPDPIDEIYTILEHDSRIDKIGKTFTTVVKPDYGSNDNIKAKVLNLLCIYDDKNSMDFFSYKIIKGENFKDYYKKHTQDMDAVPLLIGPPLEKENPIGSLVKLPGAIDYKTKKPINYKVVGVLDPSMPTAEDSVIDTGLKNNGYVVIAPRLRSNYDATGDAYGTILLKFNNPKDAKIIENELNNKIKTHKISLINMGQDFINYKQFALKDLNGMFYGIVMLLLSSFGIISISISTLMKRRREIGIRFAIGAKTSNLVVLFGGELVIIFILGGLSAFLISIGISKLFNNLLIDINVIFATSAIITTFMLISTLPIIYKTIKLKPIELIKEP